MVPMHEGPSVARAVKQSQLYIPVAETHSKFVQGLRKKKKKTRGKII